uniref:Uncharacterized protein n=1 Tax=Tanacetum cinerariifolium TaxID=118510 RepID=A0A6L2NTP3_TANCI|nr:hypothetical protein [Tanacetum cinerariifolium]
MREHRPSVYMQSPYMPLPPTSELPKKRVGKTKKNCKNDNLSPLNLGNAFAFDNVGGDDVVIMGVHDTGIYLTYENVDPFKQMNSWIEILIRSRPQNADWTVSKSGTRCVHQENNQFMIQTDPHIIGTLDVPRESERYWENIIYEIVEKQIQEDRGHQLAIMNLGHQFDNVITAKDKLQKAYEECRDIPLGQRALIDFFF